MDDVTPPDSPDLPQTEESVDYQTLAHGVLSPRHRRLCQLAAMGSSNASICKELGFSSSRMSILLKNPYIAAEVRRLQDKIFEGTIQERMKALTDPALNNIEMVLKDRTNRVKVSEKLSASQWVIEFNGGKPVQKVDIGENTLSHIMDKLDAIKTQARSREVSSAGDGSPDIEMKALPEAPKPEEDALTAWVLDFNASSES